MATHTQNKLQEIFHATNNHAKDKYRWLLRYLVKIGELGAIAAELEIFDETYDANDNDWINVYWKTFTMDHSLSYRESQVWFEKVMIGVASQ